MWVYLLDDQLYKLPNPLSLPYPLQLTNISSKMAGTDAKFPIDMSKLQKCVHHKSPVRSRTLSDVSDFVRAQACARPVEASALRRAALGFEEQHSDYA